VDPELVLRLARFAQDRDLSLVYLLEHAGLARQLLALHRHRMSAVSLDV